MLKTKKRVLFFIAILAIILAGSGAAVFFLSRSRNTDTSQQDTWSGNPLTYDLDISSLDEIAALDISPAEKHGIYIREASKKEYIGDNDGAFEYYSKANELDIADSSIKDAGNYSAYKLALRVNNEEQSTKFAELLGGLARVEELDKNMIMIDEGAE